MSGRESSEPRIFLDLQFPEPEKWGVDLGNRVYLKVSPSEIDARRSGGWTLHQLSKIAFDQIPEDNQRERIVAGRILDRLTDGGDTIELTALGPIEGDYYVVLAD